MHTFPPCIIQGNSSLSAHLMIMASLKDGYDFAVPSVEISRYRYRRNGYNRFQASLVTTIHVWV
jgi:hypothetical protein